MARKCLILHFIPTFWAFVMKCKLPIMQCEHSIMAIFIRREIFIWHGTQKPKFDFRYGVRPGYEVANYIEKRAKESAPYAKQHGGKLR